MIFLLLLLQAGTGRLTSCNPCPVFEEAQTPAQMLFEEWRGTPVDLVKAPMDASLPYVHEDDELPTEISWGHVQALIDSQGNFVKVIDSDSPLRVRLAQVVTGPRLSMAFAPGLSVGSGVLSWRGTACNLTTLAQPVDQGDIETQAIGTGIPVVGYGEASDTNRLYRNTSRPVVATQLVGGASGLATVLIASRVIAATGPWGAAAGAAMYASGALVSYLKSITPADLSTRFAGTNILLDGLSVNLQPMGSTGHCATWEFFARYGQSNSAIPSRGAPERAARRIIVQ